MDNKLSELSKPVAWTWNAYGMQHATTEEDESAELILDGVDVNPLYSQEYVSALLAELEAKDKRNAELHSTIERWATDRAESANKIDELEAYNAELRDWNAGLKQELCELKAKLATPVRLPNKNDDEFWFDGVFQVAKFDRAVERAISAAGFKFVGDE